MYVIDPSHQKQQLSLTYIFKYQYIKIINKFPSSFSLYLSLSVATLED